MDITEVSIIHHAGIVLLGLWLLSEFNLCHPVAYFISLIYLYLVHERYMVRLQKKLQFEERKKSYQRRVLADSETVRWLNHAVEKIWPVCMEQIASQKILLPIIPWFLEKYKPWTAKKAVVQHLYLGRNPPIFTEMRVLRQGLEDDHLVLELGMNFLTAEDMSAILAVKLRKRLGFGMWARLHITGMHVEGKVLIGVKFVRGWPFLGRLRVCFAEPPYFQMTVKPIFTHGIDVTEVPGIAGWLDNLLSVAFEQTLVQPNMLVVDVEKFAAPQQVSEPWFSVDVKDPVAFVKVEVIEAADLRPADLNGLADPYVKGQMGPYRFKTKIQKKTLSPKWLEEFRIPIVTWETPNVLNFQVSDKDQIFDDALGKCSVNVNDLRDGRRHDTWVPLQDVKLGRLHLAITVLEENGKGDPSVQGDADSSIGESLCTEEKPGSSAAEQASGGSFSSRSSDKSSRLADKFEPIDVEGQKETGIWIQQPGSEVSHTWEPRKGKTRHIDTEIIREQNDPLATDPGKTPGGTAHERKHSENPVGRFFGKFVSVFHRAPKKDDRVNTGEAVPSPHVNVRETSSSKTGVNLIVKKDRNLSHDGKGSESPGKEEVKGKAEAFPEQAEKPERSLEPALLEKGPGRSHGGDSSVGNVPSDSESTDDESLPPSIHMPGVEKDNTIEITSKPISSDRAGGTPKSMEMGGVRTDRSEITADSGNAMKEEGGGSVDDVSSPELPITTAMEEKGVNLDGITG